MKARLILLSLINLLQYGALLYWGGMLPLLSTVQHEYAGDQPWGAVIGFFSISVFVIVFFSFLWPFFNLKKEGNAVSALYWSLVAMTLSLLSMVICVTVVTTITLSYAPGLMVLLIIPSLFLPFRLIVSFKKDISSL